MLDDGGNAARGSARTFIEALERLEHTGDAEPLVALHGERAEVANAIDARRPKHGTSGAREFWLAYRASFEAIRSEFRNVVESGDVAILEWTSAGRTAAGDTVSYDGVSVIEFAEGRVRRFRAYFDPADLQPRPDPHGEVGA